MSWLRRAARTVRRVLYVFVAITISVCVPVLPIIFFQKRWRDREIAARVEHRR